MSRNKGRPTRSSEGDAFEAYEDRERHVVCVLAPKDEPGLYVLNCMQGFMEGKTREEHLRYCMSACAVVISSMCQEVAMVAARSGDDPGKVVEVREMALKIVREKVLPEAERLVRLMPLREEKA